MARATKSSSAHALLATRGLHLPSDYPDNYTGYQRWGSIYGTSLPRTYDTFREGDFGPFEPILPNPIDVPGPSGRPALRRYQMPVGINLPIGQPGTEFGCLASFQVQIELAETNSIARRAIEVCKSDVLVAGQKMDAWFGGWDLVPTDRAAEAMQGQPAKRKDFEERCEEGLDWWRQPDPNYLGFFDWANAALDDHLTIDAMALHLVPPRGGRKAGPFKSNVGAIELIDGSIIKPLLDSRGARPRPPEPAYQAYLWGVPRNDLMDLIALGPDATIEEVKELNHVLEELTTQVDEWGGDQLLYYIRNKRARNLYGFSPVGQALLPISIMQARQTWQFEWFRSGSLPAVFMSVGDQVTAEEGLEIQRAINMLGGDLAARHQVIVIPPHTEVIDQKKIDLTDDFDMLMTAEIAMEFGLELRDFGFMPKTGELMHSGQAAGSQQAGTDRVTRRSTLPNAQCLKWILDYFTQIKMGQKDMEWKCGVFEEGKDEKEVDDRWLGRLKGSATSIDETRQGLGLDPIGEAWSQIPLAWTANGAVAVSATVEQSLAPPPPVMTPEQALALPGGKQPPALPPGKQPPSNGSPNGAQPKQPKPEGPVTTAHAAAREVESKPKPEPGPEKVAAQKMVDAELEVLERFLRRKPLDEFVPKALSASDLSAATRSIAKGDPKSAVGAVRRANRRRRRRDDALQPMRMRVIRKLGKLVNELVQARNLFPAFVDSAVALMTDEFTQAASLGADHAAEDYDLTPLSDTAEAAEQRAEGQRPYLTSFALAVLGGGMSMAQLASRAALYGESLTGAYEQGYGRTALEGFGGRAAQLRWIASTDKEVCENCLDLHDQVFDERSLPGWPGDGGFGGDGPMCLGGPKCRCRVVLEDAETGDVLGEGFNTLRPAALNGEIEALETFPESVARWEADRAAFHASLPDVVRPGEQSSTRERAMERDRIRSEIARERSMHPADVSAADVGERVGPAYKFLAARRKAALRKSVRQQLADAQGIPPASVPTILVDSMCKQAKVRLKGLTRQVFERLAETYPEEALGWVQNMTWEGPKDIPLEGISVTGPATKEDVKRIAKKARRFARGKPIPPIVLVDPGEGALMQVADGHHRVPAALKASRPTIPAYVGTPADDEDWRSDIMDMQLVRATKNFSLGSPLTSGLVPYDLEEGAKRIYPGDDDYSSNVGTKSVDQSTESVPEPTVAGLAVVAKDTGRVLMLQRALDDEDPAGGKWEFAGGHKEEGEAPLDTAVREWQEEVGCELPNGVYRGTWVSDNSIYQGFVYLIPSEANVCWTREPDGRTVINPDDPDQDQIEMAAWFAPNDLDENPSVREEIQQSFDRIGQLLVSASKMYEVPTEPQFAAPDATTVDVPQSWVLQTFQGDWGPPATDFGPGQPPRPNPIDDTRNYPVSVHHAGASGPQTQGPVPEEHLQSAWPDSWMYDNGVGNNPVATTWSEGPRQGNDGQRGDFGPPIPPEAQETPYGPDAMASGEFPPHQPRTEPLLRKPRRSYPAKPKGRR